MFQMIAHSREEAFQSLNATTAAIRFFRSAKDTDDRAFESSVIRECIMAARQLRLAGDDYPSIP